MLALNRLLSEPIASTKFIRGRFLYHSNKGIYVTKSKTTDSLR